MNKIYKVIWSKVKNQYVVVSELAHSSGKQSRTSRSSIRSRIAALVVCGAIAAFGVLPMNSVSAQQYIVETERIGEGNGISIVTKDYDDDDWWTDHHYEEISVNTGAGLTIDKDTNKVVIDLASGKGLKFDGNKLALDIKNGSGISTDGGLHVDTGAGLSTENGQLAVKLAVDETRDNNSGLITDGNGGLKINNGNTLKIEDNTLDVKLDGKSLTAGENGLKVNAGAGLKIDTNNNDAVAVNVKEGSGLTADEENGLKLNIDENGFEIDSVTGQLKNKAVMYDKGTENDLTVDKLKAKDDVVTLDNSGAQKYSLNTIGANTQGITSYNADTKTTTVNGTLSASDVVAGDYGLKAIGDKTKGITYNAENKTTTVDGTLSATTISGLGNTNWDDTINEKSTKAATEAQLYKATQLNVKYDVDDKSSVNFGGKAYDNKANGTRLTNVAYADVNGTDTGSDAVNVDLLKDYVAENAGSTNVKAGTNIDVTNGTVSLKSDVTLDADANDGKKINLSGTNGTINAVNTTKSEPKYGWDEIKTTTTTNTFDFSDGGKFVTEKNENTVVKNLKGKITSERDLVTTNTTEFNEKGATFSKNVTDKGWKDKIILPDEKWDTTTNSSTNIDGGKITLSSDARKDDKNVVIDGTAGEITGLSNTKWDANDVTKYSTKAATEAQLYTVAGDIDELQGEVNKVGQGWTATGSDGGKTIVKPGGTLNFNGDKNIDVTADNGAINVKLNPVVALDGKKFDGDGILLNGESGSIHAVNTQAAGIVGPLGGIAGVASTNKFDFDNDGAKFEAKVSGTIGHIADNVTLSTTKTTKFDEHGATFVNKKEAKRTILGQTVGKLTDVSFTNIDGGVVTTDIVKGLNNTKWDDKLADAVDKDERLQGIAATQGQLENVDDKVNKNAIDIDALEKSDALSVKYDSETKDIVTLGGLNSDGTPQVNGGVKLTNVKYATGTDDSEAVNVGYFKDNVSTYNNLTVSSDATLEHTDGGNWTITDNNGTPYNTNDDKIFTNTTLDGTASGEVSQSSYGDYGKDYKVVDTDGNTVDIKDVASATKLQSIDTDKIGDLKYLNDREENIVRNSDSLTKSIGKLDAAIEKTNQTVNEGWYVADKNTSSDKNGNFAVKPGETLKFNGDDK